MTREATTDSDGRARVFPSVDYYAMGGTIASTGEQGLNVHPSLGAEQIVRTVNRLDRIADVRAHEFRRIPSAEIQIRDVLALAEAMRVAIRGGATGIVVSQGTDTIEETSFVLDLLWDREEPIVVTGAMRNASLPGADGPANLLSAVQIATSPEARGVGTLVCLNDEIHHARYVHKAHTSNVGAFASPGLGPIGWVSEGRVVIAYRPTRRQHLAVPSSVAIPKVALYKAVLGDDGSLLDAAAGLGLAGIVIEAMGGGHVPRSLMRPIQRLIDRMPVVLASRAGGGEVLLHTYNFEGSERDLLKRGAIRAASLDGPKARLLLTLGLASGTRLSGLAELFSVVGTTTGPVTSGD